MFSEQNLNRAAISVKVLSSKQAEAKNETVDLSTLFCL